MNIKKFMKNTIAPMYQKAGYTYSYDLEHSFSNNRGDVKITYDFLNRFAPLINGIRELRLRFCVGIAMKNCSPENFRLQDEILRDEYVLDIEDSENVARQLQIITEHVITKLLPILESMAANEVLVEDQYYEMLSSQTVQQAEAFAKQNARELAFSEENLEWSQRWLRNLLPPNSEDRQEAFQGHLSEIIQFSAFWGELIRRHKNGSWQWVVMPYTTKSIYGVFYPSRYGDDLDGYNVIAQIVNFWNFASDLNSVSLWRKMRK